MLKVDWAFLCDLAYFDTCSNLCMIGIHTLGPVRVLPIGVHRFTIAAHLTNVRRDEPLDVVLSVSTPTGRYAAADGFGGIRTEVSGDHLLISIGSAPLLEEGIYRFEVTIDGPQASLDIPLLITNAAASRWEEPRAS